MKAPTCLLLAIFIMSQALYSQSKKDLESQNKILKARVDSLQYVLYKNEIDYRTRIAYLEGVIDKAKLVLGGLPQNNSPIGNSGDYPKNSGVYPSGQQSNSQQANTQQQDLNSTFPKLAKPGSGDGLTPRTGATIYTGPRGGQYYINKNGNKTYIKKK